MAGCVVPRCRRQGTCDLPIGDGTTLEIPVCGPHRDEIAADPAAWRITSTPLRAGREHTIVERIEVSHGT